MLFSVCFLLCRINGASYQKLGSIQDLSKSAAIYAAPTGQRHALIGVFNTVWLLVLLREVLGRNSRTVLRHRCLLFSIVAAVAAEKEAQKQAAAAVSAAKVSTAGHVVSNVQ